MNVLQQLHVRQMILLIGSRKGGVGKSSTAYNLAYSLALQGRAVVLADSDDNYTCLSEYQQAIEAGHELGFVVVDGLAKRRKLPEHDILIVDSQAKPDPKDLRKAAQKADLLILPTGPGPKDLKATGATIEQCELDADDYRVLLTRIPPKPSQRGERVLAFLEGAGIATLKGSIQRRDCFLDAEQFGLPVGMMRGKPAQKAAEDYAAVANEIMDVLQ